MVILLQREVPKTFSHNLQHETHLNFGNTLITGQTGMES